MGDTLDLKIRVTGDKELDNLINKLRTGEGTLNDLTQAKKGLNAIFKDTELGTDKWKQYASSLAIINDKQRDVRLETRAGHEAYFKAGLELRQLLLTTGTFGNVTSNTSNTVNNFTSVVNNLSNSFASSVLNAVQLNRQLVPLGMSLGGVGIAIAALISVLPTVISLFREGGETVKKFKTDLDDLTKALIGSGEPDLIKAEEERIRIQARSEKNDEKRIALLFKANALEAEYNRLIMERSTLHMRGLVSPVQMGGISPLGLPGKGLGAFPGITGAEQARVFGKRPPGVSAADEARDALEAFKLTGKTTGEIFRNEIAPQGSRLAETLKSGAQQFSHTLIDALVHGKDLASSIGMALLGIFVNLGTSYLTGGISSLLGIGGTAASQGGGPPMVRPPISGERAGGRMGGLQNLRLRTEISGRNLALIVESGNKELGFLRY